MFEKNENTKKRLLALQEKQIKLIDMLRKKGLKADEEHKEKTKDAAASMDVSCIHHRFALTLRVVLAMGLPFGFLLRRIPVCRHTTIVGARVHCAEHTQPL